MDAAQVRYGQRIRVNVPGVGDHGQVGTIKKLRGNHCDVHLDWDERPWHTVMFYPADLELLPDAVAPGSTAGPHRESRQPRSTEQQTAR